MNQRDAAVKAGAQALKGARPGGGTGGILGMNASHTHSLRTLGNKGRMLTFICCKIKVEESLSAV